MDKPLTRYLISAALIIVTYLLIWQAVSVLERAAVITNSTFEFQTGSFVLADLLLVLAGASVGVILTLGRNSGGSEESGHLFLVATLPFVLVATLLLWFNGVNVGISPPRATWAYGIQSQAISAFAFGLLITVAFLRTFSGRPTPITDE